MQPFPISRPRRLRRTPALRRMVRETRLHPHDFIYPLFVQHGRQVRQPIASMPGQYRLSIDQLAAEAAEIQALGIPAVILFGIPAHKDPVGEENFADEGIVQKAVRALNERGDILNDPTLDVLARTAVSHARAGADIVAPSGMMDGMVQAIRRGLDEAGYQHIPIMSYAVKYASAYYGPFRDAAEGAPRFGDRKSHQMDPANAREALREAALDVEEGADFLMVKPALAYLDVIARVKQAYPDLPLAAYNVSGEYAMVKAAAAQGWLDERKVVLETLLGMKRAGADLILTYHAKDAARWLQEESL